MRVAVFFGGLHLASAFTCEPVYEFSWCDNSSCIHDYAFSVSKFQLKLRDYYLSNKRPPLTDAHFLARLPKTHQQRFIETGCEAPLILAYLLLAEAKLPVDDDALTYAATAYKLLKSLPGESQTTLHLREGWPIRRAVNRFSQTSTDTKNVQRTLPALLGGPSGRITLEIVVAHCLEKLDWIEERLLPITPVGSTLTLYEKCGQQPALPAVVTSHFSPISIVPCREKRGAPRGDECVGYLTHLTHRYDKLATFTVFLQADPHEHLHFSFLHIALKMIARHTYAVPFLQLNGALHPANWSPCLSTIHMLIFKEPMREVVGPYCCAQFILSVDAIRAHPLAFYQNMLMLVDGTRKNDSCTTVRTKRASSCYGMEYLWHRVFGQDYTPPLRQDDQRLPTPLRLKYGDEDVRTQWKDVSFAR
eukprot:TRINITY_DN8137_c0_g2_i1.p1 TRINITY_DN8137_c0_g2~~TRINITY_DN8137_c0_g2_i1.p1  ORF type:complete len:418 (-),score=40.59 TRINITY_DN8137_c0_g2_i1:20-1273(-)